jgi:hypothetical protein
MIPHGELRGDFIGLDLQSSLIWEASGSDAALPKLKRGPIPLGASRLREDHTHPRRAKVEQGR